MYNVHQCPILLQIKFKFVKSKQPLLLIYFFENYIFLVIYTYYFPLCKILYENLRIPPLTKQLQNIV